MPVEPTLLSSFLLIGTGFGAAFLAALWLSLIIWTYRDIRSRTRYRLARILSILVVAVLFLPGILIYIILRPPRTLDEEFQKTLEEEALLQTIDEMASCPGCSRKIKEDWIACPDCHTLLRKQCHQCNRLMELSWKLCPYCAAPVPGAESKPDLEQALETPYDFSTSRPFIDGTTEPTESSETPDAAL